MTTVGLIRHGTTEWNLLGRMQGQTDTPLSEAGRKQAELLAQRLKGENWDGIVTSDLLRAKHTAQIIAKATGIPVLSHDPRIRERNFGMLEGTTEDERVERWGERWREMNFDMESVEALLDRAYAALEDIAARYPGQSILLVSHGGVIVPLLRKLLNEPLKEYLKNTSLTVLKKSDREWTCHLLNCTKHLDAM